jgi:hypothetical protein
LVCAMFILVSTPAARTVGKLFCCCFHSISRLCGGRKLVKNFQ